MVPGLWLNVGGYHHSHDRDNVNWREVPHHQSVASQHARGLPISTLMSGCASGVLCTDVAFQLPAGNHLPHDRFTFSQEG